LLKHAPASVIFNLPLRLQKTSIEAEIASQVRGMYLSLSRKMETKSKEIDILFYSYYRKFGLN
jgi:hypothetical protein